MAPPTFLPSRGTNKVDLGVCVPPRLSNNAVEV